MILRAAAYREFQIEALFELHRRENGRDADNMTELMRWCEKADLSAYLTAKGKIDPVKVFSPEQFGEILERLRKKYQLQTQL